MRTSASNDRLPDERLFTRSPRYRYRLVLLPISATPFGNQWNPNALVTFYKVQEHTLHMIIGAMPPGQRTCNRALWRMNGLDATLGRWPQRTRSMAARGAQMDEGSGDCHRASYESPP
jgi:hypothetical protein